MPIKASTIPKKYVKVQSAQPSSAVEGDLWYDTDDEILYSYDGSTWNQLTTNLTDINQFAGQNALNILQLVAETSSTSQTNSHFIGDIYTDADGYDDTIDTGNTTATFDTDKYSNSGSTSESHGISLSNSGSKTLKHGAKITTNNACNVVSITKDSSCTATTAYVLDSSKSVIDSKTFSGDVATFDTPVSLTDATVYYLAVDSGGASFTAQWNSDTYPISGTNLDWTTGFWDGADNSSTSCVESASITSILNKIVQTDEQTLTSTPTKAMIVAHETTAGTGTVTYDISTDSGENYQTGQSSFEEITLTNTGTGLIVKQNLNGTGSGNTAEATDWGVIYW